MSLDRLPRRFWDGRYRDRLDTRKSAILTLGGLWNDKDFEETSRSEIMDFLWLNTHVLINFFAGLAAFAGAASLLALRRTSSFDGSARLRQFCPWRRRLARAPPERLKYYAR